jgi:methylthioribose-1-phosphate isomerase
MADEMLPTLRWADPPEGPAVVLLDQRLLPAEERELRCASVPELVAAIRSLAVRGAPVLGVAGAYGVALAAARGDDVPAAARELAGARPTAVNLEYGVRRALAAYRRADGADHTDGSAGPDAASAALAAASALHREDAEASVRMAGHGHRLLKRLLPGPAAEGRGYRLLTHCNTGALVSGGGGTALAVVREAHRTGELERLWVDETRPLLQGARLTAYEAAREGMPYTVLADNAAGSLFAAGLVDAVLIGADRISADGAVANKVGSYPLAVLARHHGVPFIAVAPVSTVDPGTADGSGITIEQRSAQEVREFAPGVRVTPPGAPVYNPAFDVTPPALVSAVVTENGPAHPVSRESLERVCSRSRSTE